MPKIHKCVATPVENQSKKVSIHYVMDIKCTKALNRFIASEVNNYYNLITNTNLCKSTNNPSVKS